MANAFSVLSRIYPYNLESWNKMILRTAKHYNVSDMKHSWIISNIDDILNIY